MMKHSDETSDRTHRTAPSCRRKSIASFLLLTMACANAANGSDSVAKEMRPAVASNQSVSIEEVTEATSAVLQREADNPSADPLIQEEFVGPTQSSSTTPAARTIARGRLGLRPEPLVADEKRPWWRSAPGSLLIVLGLLGLLYFFARRWAPAAKAAESGVLRIVARASLTPKHGVALVQLGRRYVLVGMAPTQVNTLCEVTDPDEVADLLIRTGSPGAGSASRFEDLLDAQSAEFSEGPSRNGSRQGSPDSPVKPLADEGPRRGAGLRPVEELLRRLRSVKV